MIIRFVINVVGFNVCWFAAVFGARDGRLWVGPLAAAVVIAIHLLYVTPPAQRPRELALIAVITLLGPLLDLGLNLAGVIELRGANGINLWFWLWFAALWANYAATINVSMRWLLGRLVLSAALGAFAGSTTYRAAELLGAVNLGPSVTVAMAAVGAGYAVAVPLTILLARRLAPTGAPTVKVNTAPAAAQVATRIAGGGRSPAASITAGASVEPAKSDGGR